MKCRPEWVRLCLSNPEAFVYALLQPGYWQMYFFASGCWMAVSVPLGGSVALLTVSREEIDRGRDGGGSGGWKFGKGDD